MINIWEYVVSIEINKKYVTTYIKPISSDFKSGKQWKTVKFSLRGGNLKIIILQDTLLLCLILTPQNILSPYISEILYFPPYRVTKWFEGVNVGQIGIIG